MIENDKELKKVINEAYENSKDKIITIGIRPTRISTDYGYIKSYSSINTITKVLEFKEKPDYATAKDYISDGKYLWNSGMFIFQYVFLIEELKKYQEDIFDVISELSKLDNFLDIFNRAKILFKDVEKISIDYAILERTNKVYVIEASFGWSDVGTYLYLEDVLDKDENNNAIKNTNYIGIDSNDNIIISEIDTNINVNLLGVNNMIISVTKDNILIVNKEDINKMKELTKKVEL